MRKINDLLGHTFNDLQHYLQDKSNLTNVSDVYKEYYNDMSNSMHLKAENPQRARNKNYVLYT